MLSAVYFSIFMNYSTLFRDTIKSLRNCVTPLDLVLRFIKQYINNPVYRTQQLRYIFFSYSPEDIINTEALTLWRYIGYYYSQSKDFGWFPKMHVLHAFWSMCSKPWRSRGLFLFSPTFMTWLLWTLADLIVLDFSPLSSQFNLSTAFPPGFLLLCHRPETPFDRELRQSKEWPHLFMTQKHHYYFLNDTQCLKTAFCFVLFLIIW